MGGDGSLPMTGEKLSDFLFIDQENVIRGISPNPYSESFEQARERLDLEKKHKKMLDEGEGDYEEKNKTKGSVYSRSGAGSA